MHNRQFFLYTKFSVFYINTDCFVVIYTAYYIDVLMLIMFSVISVFYINTDCFVVIYTANYIGVLKMFDVNYAFS